MSPTLITARFSLPTGTVVHYDAPMGPHDEIDYSTYGNAADAACHALVEQVFAAVERGELRPVEVNSVMRQAIYRLEDATGGCYGIPDSEPASEIAVQLNVRLATYGCRGDLVNRHLW